MKFSNSLFDQSNRFKVLLFDKRTKNVEKKNLSIPDNERRENGKRRRSETYIPVSLHAGRCSVSKLCISITKTASAALLVFADRSCACRLHTTWAHVLPARWNETWFARARICVRVCVHRFHTTVQWHRMATSEISDAEARGLVIIPKHSN